jgi:PTS system galactitol-specific IIA component
MRIADFLRPEAIFLGVNAQSAEAVIRLLGTKLHELGCVKDGFIEATLRREAEMPTGLPLAGEFHAAIPHVDIEYVNASALALATLAHPVVFYNMVEDDQEVPASFVMMLALDQPKSQIEMLQQVSGILQDPELIHQLMVASTPQEVLALLSGNEKS